jgi:hypothetical protein
VSAVGSAVHRLERKLGESWPCIAEAEARAIEEKEKLARALAEKRLIPADTAAVAFGSLARQEWTAGSDLDWTLLVDGPVSADHQDIARQIRTLVADLRYKGPGPTELFGGLAFSHDIVHRIGGERDTNRNTTQRILLLSESTNVLSSSAVRDRVLMALLSRYVGEDLRYRASRRCLPRFLLNDIVRYWRTITVDYADKRQERDGGWALRNIKLRMSRKLIFAAGLWLCLSCEVKPSATLAAAPFGKPDEFYAALTEHLMLVLRDRPLEVLAKALEVFGADEAARSVFGAYDSFLRLLNDETSREHLKLLTPDTALTDELFSEARTIAKRFQAGMTALFFQTDTDLTNATQLYGVF